MSYSTLQHDADTWPNLGFGSFAFASLTIYEPSGILVFLSNGTTPTTLCLSGAIYAVLDKDLFPIKSFFLLTKPSKELSYGIVRPSNSDPATCPISILNVDNASVPYGTEALSTLRIEMGHVAGSELDGRTIPYDNSLEGLVSKKKDFIGKRSLSKTAYIAPDRQRVVGVVPLDKKTSIPEGSYIVKDAKAKLPNPKLGHVSASCWSVEYDNPFSLAIIKDGKNMIGQKLFALSPLKNKTIPVEIVSSHYVDPKGERVRS